MFSKFGFCKFQSGCKREHYSEVCDQLSRCSNIKRCNKRHPKNCKRYVSGNGCRFREDCAYYHNVEKQEDPNELKMKVDILEKKMAHNMKERIEELEKIMKEKESAESKMKNAVRQLEIVVKAMTRKVLSLEEEITKIKENSEKNDEKEPFKDTHEYKSSTPVSEKKNLAGVDKKSKVCKKDQFKCEKCDYTCNKEGTLKKHTNTKHADQQCKVCSQKCSSPIELLHHIAKEHSSNIEINVNNTEGQDETLMKKLKL